MGESIVIQPPALYNLKPKLFNEGGTMGFGRKAKAVKMLRRKGQAKKKAKIKAKIAAGKASKGKK